jgi:transcriptional antiterminator
MNKAKMVAYRRQQVALLLVKGWSQYDIAKSLNCSQTTISRDVESLEKYAREELKKFIDRKMPLIHLQSLQGINQVLQSAWGVVENTKSEYVHIHALNLIHGCYISIDNLATGSGIVKDSIVLLTNKSKEVLDKISAEDVPQPLRTSIK